MDDNQIDNFHATCFCMSSSTPSMMTKYVHVSHHVVHFLYVDAPIAEYIYSVVCISAREKTGVGILIDLSRKKFW